MYTSPGQTHGAQNQHIPKNNKAPGGVRIDRDLVYSVLEKKHATGRANDGRAAETFGKMWKKSAEFDLTRKHLLALERGPGPSSVIHSYEESTLGTSELRGTLLGSSL